MRISATVNSGPTRHQVVVRTGDRPQELDIAARPSGGSAVNGGEFLMLALAFLMISNVSYPAVPTIGYRKISEILGSLVVAGTILGIIFLQKQFYFPALVAYVLYGVGKTVFFGLIGKLPRGDIPVITDDDEEFDVVRTDPPEILVPDIGPVPQRGTRRRKRRRPYPREDDNRPRDFPPRPAAPDEDL